MNYRNRLCAFATMASFALAASGLTPANAAEATRAKDTFFTGDVAAPELANDYLRNHPGNAIEILTFNETGKDPTEIFHALGPVARSRAGVCRFTATQVFPHRADDGTISWNTIPLNVREHAEPAYTMAAVAGNICPRQNEDGYAALESGITDAEFVAVSNFWKEISKSAEKFDQASVYVSLIVSQRAAEQFAAFRAALFDSGGKPPQLQGVFRGGLDAYDLAFGMASNSSNFFVSISKSSAGFEVLNFQTQY
jgi:hypothetical protein